MLPFVFLLLVPYVIQHLHVKGIDYQKKNDIALFVFFAMFTLLIMFRHISVGTDTISYMYIYEKLSNMDWSYISVETIEIGFAYFVKIVSCIVPGFRGFLIVVALIMGIVLYYSYKRLSVDSSLTIVLFCIMSTFVMSFSGIRQILAVAIGFGAYEFVRSKRIIPFLLMVLLAMAFHTSAFILIVMYPLYHVKITRKWLYVVVPIIGVIYVFNRPIFSFLVSIMERYTKYDGEISATGAYTMLFLFVIFTIFAYVIPDEALLDEEMIGLRNFLLFALVIQLFAPLHTLAMRMGYYYIIFIPLLLPKIIERRNEQWRHMAVAGRHIMVVFFAIYFLYSTYTVGALDVYPYYFFWENV